MFRKALLIAVASAVVLTWPPEARTQGAPAGEVDKWVTVTAEAAGADDKARDQAVAQALRKAVETACGVFLKAQSETRDYKTVYDKVLADTVGYVREYKVLKVSQAAGVTSAILRVRVSTKKFERAWAAIAHTVSRENNPRVIVAIVDATRHAATGPAVEVAQAGIVQGKIEDFFLSKGIKLMDRVTAEKVTRRDVLLAAIKDDTKALAAIGARFKADVVVAGRANARYGKTIEIANQEMYQYIASLTVRAVRTDSAEVLAVKTYGPLTVNTLQRSGAADKALGKLGEEFAPKVLAAVVEAWRKQVHVSRTLQILVSGMDYKMWKVFNTEAGKLRGVQALRLREITERVATIDVEYAYNNTSLADSLTELKAVKLDVTEITANRISLKVVE